MGNSKNEIILELIKDKEELNIVLQKWKGYFAEETFRGAAKIY